MSKVLILLRRVSVVGLLLACLAIPLGAAADEVPQPPYSTQGQEKLTEAARSMGAFGTEVLDLGEGMSIVGVYLPRGSGTVTLDAYIYTCEPSRCTLHAFLQTSQRKLKLALEDNATELVLKSASGMTLMIIRTPTYH
ncbi:MAG: hypothetical protein J0H86_13855 [Xanthomonadaceae bacterium]|nr:hypothetical protein [Xanthomonadaceae bacterium]